MSKQARTLRAAAMAAGLALGVLFDPATGAAQQGQIAVAQSSDILTLDPSVDISPISLNVFKHVFDQLTDIRADGSVAPLLAESWEASDDAMTWTFRIREGAKFHNGEPVTVGDVVWSYEKILADEKSPARTYLTKVKTI